MSDYIHIRDFVRPTDSLHNLLQEWNEYKINVYEFNSENYYLLSETSFRDWEIDQRIWLQQIGDLQNLEPKEKYFEIVADFPKEPYIPSPAALLDYKDKYFSGDTPDVEILKKKQLSEKSNFNNANQTEIDGERELWEKYLANVEKIRLIHFDLLERRLRGDLGVLPYFVATGFAIPNWYLDSDSFQKWKGLRISQDFHISPSGDGYPIKFAALIQGEAWGKGKDKELLRKLLIYCRQKSKKLFVLRENILRKNIINHEVMELERKKLGELHLQLFDAHAAWDAYLLTESDLDNDRSVIRLPPLPYAIPWDHVKIGFQVKPGDPNYWVKPQDLLIQESDVEEMLQLQTPPGLPEKKLKQLKAKYSKPHFNLLKNLLLEDMKWGNWRRGTIGRIWARLQEIESKTEIIDSINKDTVTFNYKHRQISYHISSLEPKLSDIKRLILQEKTY